MHSIETNRAPAFVFDDPERAVHAVQRLRAGGFAIRDVFTPFPVHGMPEAMGIRETRLAYATLTGGVIGGVSALALQWWTHAADWPLNVGGKTNIALPATIPVAFELTVLIAGLATFAALLFKGRLRPRGQAPVEQPLPGVTDDRFVVVVEPPAAPSDRTRLSGLAHMLGAVEEVAA